YEPKGFIAEVAGGRRDPPRVSVPLFLDEVPYSRSSLPPLVTVEVHGTEVAALIHTACHISLISTRLVVELGVRQDVLPDTSVPPNPLSSGGLASPWLVEGKLRYVELSLKGVKHVTQLHVARELPSDLVLGCDFLKKAQLKICFSENAVMLPSTTGTSEVRLSFLTSKELTQHQNRTGTGGGINNARAYSSNY
ncbi:unnamed protein product, partial [Meganyctiphanes norvegica]